MKKILPLMLLVPCIALGANSKMQATANKSFTATAQSSTVNTQIPVTGIVKDETGAALPGVSVSIKGTTRGTQTDVNGKFVLDAKPGDVLLFSYIGYISKQITVANGTNYDVTLAPATNSLNEVVVTALGITKTSASLSYDQQTVSGKELEVSKDPSFVNSLDGKVSGLQITSSSSGAGGSTKVILRGEKSIYGSSNVLYVVDGVPLQPLTSTQPNGVFAYGNDGGDGISNINPDDIESISVLKGASASALYGSAAANGVILITTKKGQAGKTSITFSTNTTFDKAVKIPKLQTEYAAGDNDTTNLGSLSSWGARESGSEPNSQPTQFFQTGVSSINSFDLSTGTEKSQTYISYANTHATGIEPGNIFAKNNITLRNTAKLLNDKLTLDFSANYIFQTVTDRPTSGTYYNPLTSVYLFPRGLNFDQYKTYEQYDPTRNIDLPYWIVPYNHPAGDDPQNPYWIQYRNPNVQGLNRLLGTFSAKYDINSWLNIQARINMDKTDQSSSQELYAGSTTLLAGNTGSYAYNTSASNQVYSDLLLNVNKDVSHDFNINGTLGASIQDDQFNSTGFGGHLGNVDNFFNVGNVTLANGDPFNQTSPEESQTQSLFASVDFGYKKYLFLDVTARNDWSSNLAYTAHDDFFYPSVGLSGVLSSMFHMPDFISYSKVRVSYTDVGNSIPSFVSTPAQYSLASGFLAQSLTEPLGNLKPEITHSFEAGTEWRFINDHITFDATYYHTNSYNQLFNISVSGSTKYTARYVNGGDVMNEGFEGSVGYNGDLANGIHWSSNVTFSMNQNKVVSLYVDPQQGPQNVFVFPNNVNSYQIEARVGKPFGEIYGADFDRNADGSIKLTNGLPTVQTNANDFVDLGNANPKFLLGWTNTFKVKQFDLEFTVDGRFGGNVIDMTQAYLDFYGVSEASAQARDNGGVVVDGTKVNAQQYYTIAAAGGRSGAMTVYDYSATNVRLREASIGYTFPGSAFHNKINSIRVAFTGRNLFFFYCKAPFDPETSLTNDSTLQGLDVFGQPSTRELGFNVSARF